MNKNQSDNPTTARTTVECIARWRICLHEAGHAVAAHQLINQKVTAVVFDCNYGVAYQDVGKDHIDTTEDALVVAAGKAAMTLSSAYPPPHFAPTTLLEFAYPEVASVLLGDIKATAVSDAVKLAQWAIRHVEDRPNRWARNYYRLMDQAESFIQDHQLEIVEVATGLFARGIITLPAAPAKEGKTNAD